ncbi:hypothetical protein ACTFIV_001247 [Dictyostelium citrinum]
MGKGVDIINNSDLYQLAHSAFQIYLKKKEMGPKGKKKGQSFDDSDEEINNKKGGNKKGQQLEDDIPQPVKKGGNKKGQRGKQDSDDEPENIPQPVAKKSNNKKGQRGKQDSDDEQEDIPQPVKKGGKPAPQQQQQQKKGGKQQDSDDEQEDIPQPVKKGGKTTPPQKKGGKQQDSDNEEEEEDEIPQPVKKGGKPTQPQKKGGKGGKQQESEDEEEEEEIPQPVKKGGKPTTQQSKKGGKGGKQQESEDEEEEEDIPQPVKKGSKPTKGGKGGKQQQQQQQESEEEEEEDIPQPVKKGGKPTQQSKKGGKGGKQQESEDEEEEEEIPQPVKKGGKPTTQQSKKGGKGGKQQQESEDEEEEEVPQPVKKGSNKKDQKKGGKQQQQQESEDEDEEIQQPVKKGGKKDKKKGKHVEEEEEEEEEEEIEQPIKKGGKKDKRSGLEDSMSELSIKSKKGKGKHVEEPEQEDEEEEEEEEEKPVKKSSKKDKKKGKHVEEEPEEEEEEEEKPVKKSNKKDKKKGKHVDVAEEDEEEQEEKSNKKSKDKKKGKHVEEEEEEEPQEEEEEEEEKKMTLAEIRAAKKAKKEGKKEKKKEKEKKKRDEQEEDAFELAKKKQQEEIDYDNIDIEDVPGKDAPTYVHLKSSEGLRSKIGNDIKFDNLILSVPGRILLNNASLTLAYGQKYGFVGRNGIGKSTLVKKIAMRDEITIAPHLRVLYVEQEVTGDDTTPLDCVLNADEERKWLLEEEKVLTELEKVNPSWQFDPRQKRNYSLRDIYDRLKEIDSDKASVRAANILVGLGFTFEEITVKKSRDYSGGWRMRIALARALFCKPEVLLLDEPSNHLDLHACVWLEKYLNQWDRTLLVVSHEASFLNEVVDNIIYIHDQKLDQYRGNYDAFMKQKSVNQRSKEKEKDKQDRKLKKMNEFITKNKNNTQAKQAASRAKKMEKIETIELEREDASLVVDFPEPEHLTPPLLVFKDVCFGYEGRPTMFKNLDIGIDMDSKIALVGMNGVGKSTLMKLMNGDLHETTGYIERSRKMRVARFSQHFVDQLDTTMTPIEYFQSKFNNPPVQQIRNHLGRFGICGSLPLHKITTLSGGQKSRVILAELAWAEPHILLLDEPTNHLDIDAIEALAEGINAFTGGVVLISHNQHLINLIAEQIWVVKKDGTIYLYPGTFMDYKNEISKEIDNMIIRS